jgi:hypothetical protein
MANGNQLPSDAKISIIRRTNLQVDNEDEEAYAKEEA